MFRSAEMGADKERRPERKQDVRRVSGRREKWTHTEEKRSQERGGRNLAPAKRARWPLTAGDVKRALPPPANRTVAAVFTSLSAKVNVWRIRTSLGTVAGGRVSQCNSAVVRPTDSVSAGDRKECWFPRLRSSMDVRAALWYPFPTPFETVPNVRTCEMTLTFFPLYMRSRTYLLICKPRTDGSCRYNGSIPT